MKIFKKMLLGLLLCMSLSATAAALEVSAKGAVLLDGLTGAVLFEKNGDLPLPMASTTKIMTAIVAIEQGDLDREITVKKEYTLTEGSSMYLKVGEKLPFRHLLYGLLLSSGNDAALAIAGECGPDFVAKMNQKASELGLSQTSFANPNGLDAEGHQTTPRELAILTRYALQNETFRQLVATKTITLGKRQLSNHNKLLRSYGGATGVKTGFTKKSGRCLVSSAVKDGREMIVVTLNAGDDWNDHKTLLDHGFTDLSPVVLHKKGELFGNVSVISGQKSTAKVLFNNELVFSLKTSEKTKIRVEILSEKMRYAPVKEGQLYGIIKYYIGDCLFAEDSLVFGESVTALAPEKTFFEKILDFFKGLV